jgi:hypothetical protein
MSIFGMSDMTKKYIEALRREGDKFDYLKWYRENRNTQTEAKPADVGLESPPATESPCPDDDGASKPAAGGGSDLDIGRPSLATATRSAPTFVNRGAHQRGGPTAELPPTPLLQPSAATSGAKRAGQGSRHAISRSTRVIQAELSIVSKAWKEFQSSRGRDAVYGYLGSVYDLVRHWERRGRADKKARRALKVCGLKGWKNTEPYAVAIACTSEPGKVDRKTISKWSRVLRYVASCPPSNEPLKDFIKRKGGINACASRFARRLGRKS